MDQSQEQKVLDLGQNRSKVRVDVDEFTSIELSMPPRLSAIEFVALTYKWSKMMKAFDLPLYDENVVVPKRQYNKKSGHNGKKKNSVFSNEMCRVLIEMTDKGSSEQEIAQHLNDKYVGLDGKQVNAEQVKQKISNMKYRKRWRYDLYPADGQMTEEVVEKELEYVPAAKETKPISGSKYTPEIVKYIKDKVKNTNKTYAQISEGIKKEFDVDINATSIKGKVWYMKQHKQM